MALIKHYFLMLLFIPFIVIIFLFEQELSNVPNDAYVKGLIKSTIESENLDDYYIEAEGLHNTRDNWLGDGEVFIKIEVKKDIINKIKSDPLWNKPEETDLNKENVMETMARYIKDFNVDNIRNCYWKFIDRTEYFENDTEKIVRNYNFLFYIEDENCLYVLEYNS